MMYLAHCDDLGDEGEDVYLLLYNYHIINPEIDAFAINPTQSDN